MSARCNWDRVRVRDRMRRYGVESARGEESPKRIASTIRGFLGATLRPACSSATTSPNSAAPAARRPNRRRATPLTSDQRHAQAAAFVAWRAQRGQRQ